jgi:hypothetical protein
MNLLIAHLVGDYLFQNRWMALNKHKNPLICVLHAAVYTLSVALICGWWDARLIVVFLSHEIIDCFRIGAKWRQFFSRDTELPWTILADNTMHLLILWGLSLV